MSTRAFGSKYAELNPYYPRLLGTRGAIASEHYLAAQAGADVLKGGGNAVDAAVCAVFVEGVVNPQMHTIGGECPMLICMADSDRVISINGNTMAPERPRSPAPSVPAQPGGVRDVDPGRDRSAQAQQRALPGIFRPAR